MNKSLIAALGIAVIFAANAAYAQSALVETTPQVRVALVAEMAAPMAQAAPTGAARELQIALHPEYELYYAALLDEDLWAPAPAPYAMNVPITPRFECEAFFVMAQLAAQ